MKAIADTGFLVAFGNRNDYPHEWAAGIAERVTEPLLTREAVLAETAFHLGSSALVLAFLRDGLARSAMVLKEHVARLAELAARYADHKPDLADLCSIRLSELHPRYRVITTDLADFRVYRRGRREAIPLVHPPERQQTGRYSSQEWEQGRTSPDSAVRAYLTVIERNPRAVIEALAGR